MAYIIFGHIHRAMFVIVLILEMFKNFAIFNRSCYFGFLFIINKNTLRPNYGEAGYVFEIRCRSEYQSKYQSSDV